MRKEGNVLFNDALKTFYLRLYGVTHMVKNHSDNMLYLLYLFVCISRNDNGVNKKGMKEILYRHTEHILK